MKKSELKAELRRRRIHNDYYFFADQPYIHRVPGDSMRGPCWAVEKRGVKLSSHWYDYGAMRFAINGRHDITPARLRAQEWASEKFGVREWAIGPFGGYGPKEWIENRIKVLLDREVSE